MPSTSSSIFAKPSNTRLVTIAAHVDSGKTTLADNLIEHNGIISERIAGTLRYLDSDPEEQRRGITMRSSAIGLQYRYTKGKEEPQNVIVHLVDSPGHTDFSKEVSTSMLACDAAILVIDAVEGVRARTQQVFRETERYELTPVLVINKIDRLQSELCLTPTEAYLRLRTLLETINAAASAVVTAALNNADQVLSDKDKEAKEKRWTFDPAVGNVIFASALLGYGFTVQSLCRSLFRSGTVSVKPPLLRQYMFGDFKLKNSDKIVKWKQNSGGENDILPLFAKFALQPIWAIHEGVNAAAVILGLSTSTTDGKVASNEIKEARIRAETPGMEQVLKAFRVGSTSSQQSTVRTTGDLQTILSQTGAGGSEEATLRAVLRRYRPLADVVLHVVCEYCPSPVNAASASRSHALALQDPPQPSKDFERIRRAVQACDDNAEAPTVAHVCKFLFTDRQNVRDPELSDADGANLILGFARVLSGRLRTNDEYYLFGPKRNEEVLPVERRKIRLYLFMGSSFVRVEEVPAGHLAAVFGLDDVDCKSLTLSDDPSCQPLRGSEHGIRPLVKVHIEPENAADAEVLERGLRRLSLADAAVEVSATDKGERLLSCLGELHLEQSILDLENVYCDKEGVKLRISDPVVDFAESTTWFENGLEANYSAFFENSLPQLRQTMIPPYNEEEGSSLANHGRMRSILSGRSAAISLRVIPLAPSVYRAMRDGEIKDDNVECKEELIAIGRALNVDNFESPEEVLQDLLSSVCALDTHGNALVEFAGVQQGSFVRGIESTEVYFPQRDAADETADTEGGTINCDSKEQGLEVFRSLRRALLQSGLRKNGIAPATDADKGARALWKKSMKGSVVAGFEAALRAGPVCEEPIRNVMVVVESAEVSVRRTEDGNYAAFKPLAGGMVVSAMRTGIRCALLSRPIRLMEGHLRLTVHSSLTGLGPLYQVLSKRRGKVVEDTMVDGTDLLMITALVPQAEAFGLTPELLAKTSGEVSMPEMLFSHWERLDVDPFWIPTSDLEREDFGELQNVGDSSTGVDNTALSYIRLVRKRKGLTVDSSRTVANAEKQRTLKR